MSAALAAGDSPPKAYETLVAPYPVWAAMHACGVPRTGEKHRSVATGLFKDDFKTCIDLNDSALYIAHSLREIRLLRLMKRW